MARLKMQRLQIGSHSGLYNSRPARIGQHQAKVTSKSVQIAHLLYVYLVALSQLSVLSALVDSSNQLPSNSTVSDRLPAGAICQPSAQQLVRPVKSPSFFEKLSSMLGSNSAVNLMNQTRLESQQAVAIGSDQSNRQQVFESICGGWTNNITYGIDTHRKPIAFWAHDPLRGALVAKMVFYDRQELIEIYDRQARLLSPLFRPIPTYHTMPGKYFNSCLFTYSFYLNVPGNLDLTLLLKTSSSAPPERVLLDKNSKGKNQSNQRQQSQEGDLWTTKNLSLPFDLSPDAPFRLEFTAILSPLGAGVFSDSGVMKSVAITNMSLSPQCFGLDVEVEELDRLRRVTGREPLSAWSGESSGDDSSLLSNLLDLVEKYQNWLILIGILLLILIAYSQFIMFSTIFGNRHQNPFSQPVLRCCCLSIPIGSGSRRKRARVYAANQQESQNNDGKQAQNGSLMPLRCILGSDRLELVENQNYQSSTSEVNRMALVERALYDSLNRYHIDRNRLTLTQQLGKGAFGQVYQGYLVCDSDSSSTEGAGSNETSGNSMSNSSLHSIKVAVKTYTDERINRLDFMREASNMAATKHKNIVQLLGVCFEDKPLYIVMELCQGGNLKDFLLRNRHKDSPARSNQCFTYYNACSSDIQAAYRPIASLSPASKRPSVNLCMGDLLVFALDIARACRYLQLHQFIHRDLATRNCLLTSNVRASPSSSLVATGDQQAASSEMESISEASDVESLLSQVYLNGFRNSSMVVKLADFGMTRDVLSTDYYRTAHKEMPVRWMPPESLDGVATINSDVWSFGVLLWELFSMGQMPYQHLPDNHKVIEFIRSRRHTRPVDEQAAGVEPELATRVNDESPLKPERPHTPVGSTVADATTELLLTISDENVSTTHQHADQVRLLSSCKLVSLDEPNSSTATTLERDPDGRYSRAEGSPFGASGTPDSAPLPRPHDNTPDAIYAIMCSCWANEPENRPNFEQVCLRLYECLQMTDVLDTSLPLFYDT